MEFLFAAMERPESAQIDENASLDGDESTTTESDATIDAEASLEMSAIAFLRAPTGHLKGVRELSDGRFTWGPGMPARRLRHPSTAALAVSRYVEQKKRSRPLARPTVDDDDESPPKQMRPASNGDFFWTPEESETVRLLRTMPAADALRKWEVVARTCRAHADGRAQPLRRLRERDAGSPRRPPSSSTRPSPSVPRAPRRRSGAPRRGRG